MDSKTCEIPDCGEPATRWMEYRTPPTKADEVTEETIGLTPPLHILREYVCDRHADAVVQLYGQDAVDRDVPIAEIDDLEHPAGPDV